MKKIILAATVAAALSTSVMAFDLVDKDENIVVFVGITNVFDADYFIGTHDYPDSTTAGHTGTQEDSGYSISIGLEDNIDNNDFGTRKMLTYYDDGKKIYADGNYYEAFSNKGIEASYEIFYKINNHLKPYIAAGIGMNDSTSEALKRDTTTHNKKWGTSGHSYDMTGIMKLGVTGEIIASIEYFAEYKYRAGGESSQIDVLTASTDLPNAVKHETITLGLGYKF